MYPFDPSLQKNFFHEVKVDLAPQNGLAENVPEILKINRRFFFIFYFEGRTHFSYN